jgi:protein involved in polysaccharide export with SLBB domain
MRQNALRRFLCSSVCSALLGGTAAVAQQGAASPLSLWQLLEQVTPGQSARMVLPELPPADHVVSAEHYVVGPGDVLLLQIVAPVVQEHVLVVSPDGELLLPRIGALSVQGRTLAWVRSEVERRVRERNPKAEAVVLLQKARTVLVTVRGYVRFPGVYALPATVRVSTAVRLAVLGRMEQSGAKARNGFPTGGEHAAVGTG